MNSLFGRKDNVNRAKDEITCLFFNLKPCLFLILLQIGCQRVLNKEAKEALICWAAEFGLLPNRFSFAGQQKMFRKAADFCARLPDFMPEYVSSSTARNV
ncbi:MAG: hypothetical protein IJ417_07775 [Bacteroidaceae bacterium]|nr:hypothetical protein [Bacteroidaceae bacterium]